jgi:RNA polymerase sigma-70 factor, ECF subfamily
MRSRPTERQRGDLDRSQMKGNSSGPQPEPALRLFVFAVIEIVESPAPQATRKQEGVPACLRVAVAEDISFLRVASSSAMLDTAHRCIVVRIQPSTSTKLMSSNPKDITLMLEKARGGNQEMASRLVALLYDELRRLASFYLKHERPDHTLQATALVNEAYLRLLGQNVAWKNRNHFFGIAAQQMRRILVDYARRQHRAKRGGPAVKVSLDDAMIVSNENPEQILAVDEALGRLAALDPQQARIVELRVFAGLTVDEVAEVMGISVPSVKREWTIARAWFSREINQRQRA